MHRVESPVDSRVIIARRDGSCSSGAGPWRAAETAGRAKGQLRGKVVPHDPWPRLASALGSLCAAGGAGHRLLPEFLDGGEEATPMVAGVVSSRIPVPIGWPELPFGPGL